MTNVAVEQREPRMILALGLFDLTERDRALLGRLAEDPEAAEAAADLFARLTRR